MLTTFQIGVTKKRSAPAVPFRAGFEVIYAGRFVGYF
ncbi:MAG: hypothetical protein ACJAWQ_001814 [Paraglaciecola sp.]|jgi:hypothetical protein